MTRRNFLKVVLVGSVISVVEGCNSYAETDNSRPINMYTANKITYYEKGSTNITINQITKDITISENGVLIFKRQTNEYGKQNNFYYDSGEYINNDAHTITVGNTTVKFDPQIKNSTTVFNSNIMLVNILGLTKE
jgi:flagellar hook protein FlgE